METMIYTMKNIMKKNGGRNGILYTTYEYLYKYHDYYTDSSKINFNLG
jgi:hypothetical protein